MFTTPLLEERIFQDKIVSSLGDTPFRPNVSKEVYHRWGYKNTLTFGPNIREFLYIERNLIDLDDLVALKTTSLDSNVLLSKIEILREKVVEEYAKHTHLEKEK